MKRHLVKVKRDVLFWNEPEYSKKKKKSPVTIGEKGKLRWKPDFSA